MKSILLGNIASLAVSKLPDHRIPRHAAKVSGEPESGTIGQKDPSDARFSENR